MSNMLMLLVVAVYLVVTLKDVIVISSVTSLMIAVLILKILDAFRKVGNNRFNILFSNYIQCRHISGIIIFWHYVINTRTRYENEGRMYMIILKKNNFSNIFHISQETHQHFHLLLSLSVCQQLSHNLQVTWIHVTTNHAIWTTLQNRLVI